MKHNIISHTPVSGKQTSTRIISRLGLLILCCLPILSFAAPVGSILNSGGSASFFAPPSTDVSIKVIAAIFGSGPDEFNGKLIRPLLSVLCSGVVIFMGVIFAWNITKFVLHSSQHGEMMVGRGKELGFVILRSVFGMSMVMPIYVGTYKGLCMAFIIMGWLITQGVGLADRGINSIVSYLEAGGTIYQINRPNQDTPAKQELVTPIANILAAQACVYKLREIRKQQIAFLEKLYAEFKGGKGSVSVALPLYSSKISFSLPPIPTYSDTDVDMYLDKNTGIVSFGTRNKDPNGTPAYFNECGQVQANWSGVASADKNSLASNALAATGNLAFSISLQGLAKNIAAASPNQPASITANIPPLIANAVVEYTNAATPFRADTTGDAVRAAQTKLDKIRRDGWIVLGAYYPMMGSLNTGLQKTSLSQFVLSFTPGAKLQNGAIPDPNPNSVFNLSSLTQAEANDIKNLFTYVNDQGLSTSNLISKLNSNSEATLADWVSNNDSGQGRASTGQPGYLGWVNASDQGFNKWVSSKTGSAVNGLTSNVLNPGIQWASSGLNTGIAGIITGANEAAPALDIGGQITQPGDVVPTNDSSIIPEISPDFNISVGSTIGSSKITNWLGESIAGFDPLTGGGEDFRGLISNDKADSARTTFNLASIPAGPVAWGSIPFMTDAFVRILDKFRNAIDQTQNPDPLLAIQQFGFDVMEISWKMILMIFATTFIAAFLLGFIPSSNPVGGTGVAATMDSTVITLGFAAMLMLGIICGIYLPMIPFIVWISAILGWIGQTFQAVIGAPLVALRMTTAEGEGVLGGAVEGVMMLLGVLLTPFLLVMGMTGALILIKQLLIVINSLFATFAFESFIKYENLTSWVIIGVPALLFIYFTLLGTVIQGVCTKLIAEMPSEVMRHLHNAMVGHKASEQMLQKMEHGSEKMGSTAGDYASKKAYSAPDIKKSMGGGGGGDKGKEKK